jgi:hypothetical protein
MVFPTNLSAAEEPQRVVVGQRRQNRASFGQPYELDPGKRGAPFGLGEGGIPPSRMTGKPPCTLTQGRDQGAVTLEPLRPRVRGSAEEGIG